MALSLKKVKRNCLLLLRRGIRLYNYVSRTSDLISSEGTAAHSQRLPPGNGERSGRDIQQFGFAGRGRECRQIGHGQERDIRVGGGENPEGGGPRCLPCGGSHLAGVQSAVLLDQAWNTQGQA